MQATVIIRDSYDYGMEAIPFRSAESAKDWLEEDKKCAKKKLAEEGYTPIEIPSGVTCEEFPGDIYYDYWVEENAEFNDSEEPSNTEMCHVVVTSAHCGLEELEGTIAHVFHNRKRAEEWLEKTVKRAKHIVKEMGYTPYVDEGIYSNDSEISDIITEEDGENGENNGIHFSAWLFPDEHYCDCD